MHTSDDDAPVEEEEDTVQQLEGKFERLAFSDADDSDDEADEIAEEQRAAQNDFLHRQMTEGGVNVRLERGRPLFGVFAAFPEVRVV